MPKIQCNLWQVSVYKYVCDINIKWTLKKKTSSTLKLIQWILPHPCLDRILKIVKIIIIIIRFEEKRVKFRNFHFTFNFKNQPNFYNIIF